MGMFFKLWERLTKNSGTYLSQEIPMYWVHLTHLYIRLQFSSPDSYDIEHFICNFNLVLKTRTIKPSNIGCDLMKVHVYVDLQMSTIIKFL